MCLYYSGGNIRGRHEIIQYISLEKLWYHKMMILRYLINHDTSTSTIHQDICATEHKNNIEKKELSDYWTKVSILF